MSLVNLPITPQHSPTTHVSCSVGTLKFRETDERKARGNFPIDATVDELINAVYLCLYPEDVRNKEEELKNAFLHVEGSSGDFWRITVISFYCSSVL